MNAHPNKYLQALATDLQHETLEAYLKKRGEWTMAPSRRAEVACYKHATGRWIQVPIDLAFADHTRALIYATAEIAELEGRSVEALLLELVPPLYAAKLVDLRSDKFPNWIDDKHAEELRLKNFSERVLLVRSEGAIREVWEGEGDLTGLDDMLNEAFALGRKLGL